jgi:hypothetical protein
MMTCVVLTWHGVAARLAASHCALLTCADAPRLFARVRAGAAAGRALKALGLTLLAVGLIVYYGQRPNHSRACLLCSSPFGFDDD